MVEMQELRIMVSLNLPYSSIATNMRIYQFDDNANDVGGDKDNADCLGLVQRHLYGAAA